MTSDETTHDPRVSIVIRCYNEERHIGRLLDGIMEQSHPGIEIIVVDSGSSDATVTIASRYPTTIVSIDPQEFSFGRALNLGFEQAHGEFVIIASAHVYPSYRTWIHSLLVPFSDPKVALVYGKQRGNEVTKYPERQIFSRWFGEHSINSQHHPFCNNANAAIRRSLWQRFPYDESLTGLEDIAWAKTVLESGYRICYQADAEIVHVHEETYAQIYNRYRREAIAMKSIFPEEHFNLADFLRLYASNVGSDLYHAWHDGQLLGSLGSIFGFRLMQFLGTYRGFGLHGPVPSDLKQRFYYPNRLTRMTTQTPEKHSSVRIEYKEKSSPHPKERT